MLTPVLLACASLAVVQQRPRWGAVLVLVVFAVTTAFFFTRPGQREHRKEADFHSVFFGVAMTSSAPATVLTDLGFSPQAAPLVGRSNFAADTERLSLPWARSPSRLIFEIRRTTGALAGTRGGEQGTDRKPKRDAVEAHQLSGAI